MAERVMMIRKVLRVIFFPLVLVRRQYLKKRAWRNRLRVFDYDKKRFLRYAGCCDKESRESKLAEIIMAYHIVEKGLTMPRRHFDFGHAAVLDLLAKITDFVGIWGISDRQVQHAIGVVKSYLKMHQDEKFNFSKDAMFWKKIKDFCQSYDNVSPSNQYHFSRDTFFASCDKDFMTFALSRHTVRHYSDPIPDDVITSAVSLAMTAPSACNRQHTHVHCISNHNMRDRLLSIQNGNRGFGSDADKLLVVTTCLNDIQYIEERNDPYVNAGIFIMNLCYSLHYYKIACCILNWHASPETDIKARELMSIPDSESIVAIISCGLPPKEFDVAQSPRKAVDDILVNHQ